ncbi:hypothetical protein ACIPL1_04345 [Pseudomonas sp. NPDC090202]|uniref:hypothetical protein n=1 Tax=unclassified Pseudomonas TaxID=196821 RepID=UPI0037F9A4A2
MNAGHEPSVARGLSASSEARQILADWLRMTQAPKTQAPDYRTMLLQRYPSGLIDEAEMEALLGILDS